jgi:hypothetical protein
MSKTKKTGETLEEGVDVTGLQLRNYFQKRLEDREPKLILKQKQGNFEAYSRLCQSSESRQPVIVTKAEMAKIQEEYPEYKDPKHYMDYIEYGTDPANKYTYLCPKYWNMKTNKPVSEADMKTKNLERHIIPRDAKTIPANTYIYEFTNKKGIHYPYPNFISDSHPDGFCLPCCFKDYETKKRMEVKAKCSQGGPPPAGPAQEKKKGKEKAPPAPEKEKEKKTRKRKEPTSTAKTKKQPIKATEPEVESDEEEDEDSEEKEKEEPIVEDTLIHEEPKKDVAVAADVDITEEPAEKRKESAAEYIKGPDKFPLEPGRWGYLPVGLQKLLEHDNTKCQISSTNALLKPGHPCLLRHGIPYNPNQSFLQCIADISGWTLPQLKERLVDFLEFDAFLMMNNGNLVNDFFNDPNHKVSEDIMRLCKTSNFYRNKLDKTDKDYEAAFERACISYDIFMNYLMDPNAAIDHTYLWDIVSTALKISIVAFEIPDDDITDNVEVICPTNHYSKNLLASPYKDIVIIIKKDNLYEPVYMYTRADRGPPHVDPYFKKKDPTVDSIRTKLKEIEKFMQDKCKPENIYKMKPPVPLKMAIDIFKKPNQNYTVVAQVVNYNTKVIGLFVDARIKTGKKKDEYEHVTCMVPVQPTGILDKTYKDDPAKQFYKQTYVATDPLILSSYEDTIKFYDNLCKNTEGKIPCKLVLKVVEDEMVVGFLTNANQFVMIDPPVPMFDTIDDGIEVLDEIFAPSPTKDKNIANADPIHNKFAEKRQKYVSKLKEDSAQYIIFRNAIKYLLSRNPQQREIIKSLIHEKENIDTKRTNFIGMLEDLEGNKIEFLDQRRLPVPLEDINIKGNGDIKLKGPDNKRRYYYKIADDLIRNTRLREYLLSGTPIVVEKDDYDINPDEIILNESMVLDYYENLKPTNARPNKYTSYDEAQPGNYKQVENLDHYNFYKDNGKDKNQDCIADTTSSAIAGRLAKIFPKQENRTIRFKCSFGLMQSLIPEKTTIIQLKVALIAEYKKYSGYNKVIYRLLKKQGKTRMIEELENKKLSLEDIILSENYYLTTLDIWLLCVHYTIPCILVSKRKDQRKGLLESGYQEKSFLLYGNTPEDQFAFIVVPGIKQKKNSLQLMQQTNKGNVRDSYLYEESDLLTTEPITVAFEHAYPFEVMLQMFDDQFKKGIDDKDDESDDDEED